MHSPQLCLQLVDTGGRLVENEKGIQPTVLRSQAVSTLTAFVPLHYDCLVPSMEDVKRMIESGLRVRAENCARLDKINFKSIGWIGFFSHFSWTEKKIGHSEYPYFDFVMLC